MCVTWDANQAGEQGRKREQLKAWLLRVWEWAMDNNNGAIALDAGTLMSRIGEDDYPAWRMAKELGLIGEGKRAKRLSAACGAPPSNAPDCEFARDINYSPVIYLDEKTWRHIHGALGWVNRNMDIGLGCRNFWLVSSAGNVVRFAVRKEDRDAVDSAGAE